MACIHSCGPSSYGLNGYGLCCDGSYSYGAYTMEDSTLLLHELLLACSFVLVTPTVYVNEASRLDDLWNFQAPKTPFCSAVQYI